MRRVFGGMAEAPWRNRRGRRILEFILSVISPTRTGPHGDNLPLLFLTGGFG